MLFSLGLVLQVLVLMRQYKDDLLASCLQLLLALPKQLVELELEALVPALQVSSDRLTTFANPLGGFPTQSGGTPNHPYSLDHL